ncbi:MAG: AgmX/PglI C-terminal domain-containing protein [Rhodocyclales bacterium]|nr:AgmX/PglI C-terminal domain-containing protein [Rhodocyclales bacterium]
MCSDIAERQSTTQAAVIAALAATLIASWGWFYFAQQRTDEQVAMLMSKVAAAPAQRGARAGADPYRDEAVKNTLRKHAAGIQAAWIAYLAKHPARTEGAIEADWQIDPDGRVAEAAIIHSDFEDQDLSEAVAKALRDIRYPPPPTGSQTYVAHKFNLKKD